MGHMNRNDDGNVHETQKSNLKEPNRQELLLALQLGYESMGAINLQYAESIQEQDLTQLERYESTLALGRD